MKTYISYSLPKSVTTAALVKRKPFDAYESVIHWLSAHSNYEIGDNIQLSLTVPVPAQFFDAKVIERVDRDHYTHTKWGSVNDYYTGKEISEFLAWSIPNERIKIALTYMHENSEVLAKYNGQITIGIHFLLLDTNGRVLPGQHLDSQDIPQSHFLLFLSKNSCIAPEIYFPFNNYDDAFKRYYHYLNLEMPFKLNNKHLRLCSRNEKGNIVRRKLE
jgi:hypothetical protein